MQPPIVRAPLLARLRLPHGKLISFGVTVVVSLLFLIAPVYSSGRTLVEINGPRVFGVLAVPVLIALGPGACRWLTIPAALAMLAFSRNLWRRLGLPKRIDTWSLLSLQQRLIRTGGRLVKHARYYWLLLAEGHPTRRLFGAIVQRLTALSGPSG